MVILLLLSALCLMGFVSCSVKKFGLLKSYSAYSSKWSLMIAQQPVWSVVTFVSAMLLIPPMIEVGTDNPFQCCGFFAPVYLIVVSLTPNWQKDKMQHKVHVFGAAICAAFALVWLILICHLWHIVLYMTILILALAIIIKRYDAYVFWGEMILFISVYLSLILQLWT